MTKTLIGANVATREQRKRLPMGTHWRGIDPDVHLGYRKQKRGGVWLARWYEHLSFVDRGKPFAIAWKCRK